MSVQDCPLCADGSNPSVDKDRSFDVDSIVIFGRLSCRTLEDFIMPGSEPNLCTSYQELTSIHCGCPRPINNNPCTMCPNGGAPQFPDLVPSGPVLNLTCAERASQVAAGNLCEKYQETFGLYCECPERFCRICGPNTPLVHPDAQVQVIRDNEPFDSNCFEVERAVTTFYAPNDTTCIQYQAQANKTCCAGTTAVLDRNDTTPILGTNDDRLPTWGMALIVAIGTTFVVLAVIALAVKKIRARMGPQENAETVPVLSAVPVASAIIAVDRIQVEVEPEAVLQEAYDDLPEFKDQVHCRSSAATPRHGQEKTDSQGPEFKDQVRPHPDSFLRGRGAQQKKEVETGETTERPGNAEQDNIGQAEEGEATGATSNSESEASVVSEHVDFVVR